MSTSLSKEQEVRWAGCARGRGASAHLVFVFLLLCNSFMISKATVITEDFSTQPLLRGWSLIGDPDLFSWDPTNRALFVTWDSSRPNSYYYFPLGTILTREDDFSLSLDLQLTDATGGINPDKPSTFELALGFLNLATATQTNFLRGNSSDSPNLVEFDYFPDTGFGPTVWPAVWSTNSSLNYNGSSDYTLLALPTGVQMRLTMVYAASNSTLIVSITTNGVPIGAINSVQLSTAFTDFRVGAFAIESYNDAGQDPRYGGSLLAHGTVDNILLRIPPPPVQNLSGNFSNNEWQVTFVSRANWIYTLERTSDFRSWIAVSGSATGTGTNLTLRDIAAPTASSFYRVRAERP